MSYGAGDDGEAAASLTPNVPSPEGYNDPQPMLYGGGEEAAAIASRYVGKRKLFSLVFYSVLFSSCLFLSIDG